MEFNHDITHTHIQQFDDLSLNKKLLTQIMELPDGLRKEIRLLSKQYEILEIRKEPPTNKINDFTIKEQPYIIKYKHFGYGNEEFEWVVDADRFN